MKEKKSWQNLNNEKDTDLKRLQTMWLQQYNTIKKTKLQETKWFGYQESGRGR